MGFWVTLLVLLSVLAFLLLVYCAAEALER